MQRCLHIKRQVFTRFRAFTITEMAIPRMLYKCWKALTRLLEFFGCQNDNPESPLLHQEESDPLLGSQSHEYNNEFCENERSDTSLSSLSFSIARQNSQSNSEGDTYDDHELSTLPVAEGVSLDRMVQSPSELSLAFRSKSRLMPPSIYISDFSTEILLEIFRYLAVVDPNDRETSSPLVLGCLLLVCQRWKAIVDKHCRGRFLTATPGFLVQDRDGEPPAWSRRLDAWCITNDTGSVLDIVSFYLSNHFASSWLTLNVEHARIFTRALMKCKTARLFVDLTEAEVNEDVSAETTLPESPLREFSWTSQYMGIQHIFPEVYRFPWITLWQGLPWQQLTHVDLNCPLSLCDAYYVLAHGTNLTNARLATLKSASNSNQDGLPLFHPASTPVLRSLTIHSQLKLHMLFSNLELPKLAYFSLSVVHPHSSLGLVVQDSRPNLELSLKVPWERIEELDIYYESGHKCDVSPILSACHRLQRLSLVGDLTIGTVANFVRCLDNATFGADIVWLEPSLIFRETTIKKLQITSHEQLRHFLNFKAVDELSITDPISIELLLDTLREVPSLRVGNFQVRSVSLQAVIGNTAPAPAPNLHRLDVTTSEGLIQVVSDILKSQIIHAVPASTMSTLLRIHVHCDDNVSLKQLHKVIQ